jgi:hypothetical protein
MADDSTLDRFNRLNVWSRAGQRAPHKPLLALCALGRWTRGDTGETPLRDVDRELTPPLKEFGPPRLSRIVSSIHTSRGSRTSARLQARRTTAINRRGTGRLCLALPLCSVSRQLASRCRNGWRPLPRSAGGGKNSQAKHGPDTDALHCIALRAITHPHIGR